MVIVQTWECCGNLPVVVSHSPGLSPVCTAEVSHSDIHAPGYAPSWYCLETFWGCSACFKNCCKFELLKAWNINTLSRLNNLILTRFLSTGVWDHWLLPGLRSERWGVEDHACPEADQGRSAHEVQGELQLWKSFNYLCCTSDVCI